MVGKRIAYLCLDAGGQGQASYTHVHEIIKHLRGRGWRVDLYQPSYGRHARCAPGPVRRAFEFAMVQVKLWWRARQVKALYVRSHFAALPTVLLGKLRRVPVVLEVNGPYDDLFIAWPWTRYLAPLFVLMMRAQLCWADAIVAVTPELRQWIRREVGQRRVYVIPNGANVDLFHPAAASGALDLPKPYVVFFGALARWQGLDTLLDAVQVPQWPDEVSLVIVGDGPERRRVVDSAQCDGHIWYIGVRPYREMPGIVAGSIAGLVCKNDLGGRSETGLSPLKLYETLACGVPALVTDLPGLADVVRSGECGVVVPPHDKVALAQAVSFLYHDCAQRRAMGSRGRRLIEEEHSWSNRAGRTEEILQSLVDL